MRRLLFGLALWLAASVAALAAPKSELWDYWDQHDEQSGTVVNHGAWETFLQQYVVASPDGINRVRYNDIDYEGRARLTIYLQDLGRVKVSKLRRDEQLALWINLYNAYAVKLVVDHYPVGSINSIDISPGLFQKGPFAAKLLKVEEETLSLDDIEHRILRPIWKDPRIHYAVCPASLGGPSLWTHAYTAANTQARLDEAAKDFVNQPRAVRIEDGKLHVSSLYDWYKGDFGGSDHAVIEHLSTYASPALAMDLSVATKIKDDAYDWLLNDAHPMTDLE